jgi:3-phenylpropionate/trans-cinnamate dioxygenase ferredoxin subunit
MNWVKVASVEQLQDDEVVAINAVGRRIALYRDKGDFFATDNICTHAEALMSDGYLEDGCIECPLHQARFDIRTGKALCAPATVDLRTYAVKREGGDVFVDIPVGV